MDILKTFQIVWKIFKHYGMFLDTLKTFPSERKVSKLYPKFPEYIESFWKLSRLSKNFPECLGGLNYRTSTKEKKLIRKEEAKKKYE